MENSFLNALLKGIICGLICALIVMGARTLISGTGFLSNLRSIYGILTLICFPVFFVLWFYMQGKKK